MATAQPVPAQPDYRDEVRRPGRGLAVASLVLGVASLVAAISFVLFPVALVGGLIGAILGIIALSRRRGEGGNGQAVAGLILSLLALALAITWTVRVGTWARHNRRPLTTLSKCLTKANRDPEVRACFVQFANQVRG